MKFEGRVEWREIARGTKSQREVAVLRTESGVYPLRRQGGPSFGDEELNRLIGKRISCDGRIIEGNVLVISACDVLDDRPNDAPPA